MLTVLSPDEQKDVTASAERLEPTPELLDDLRRKSEEL